MPKGHDADGVTHRTRPAFYYFANAALRVIFRVILKLDVQGVQNVPENGPLIVAISHSSFLDPLLAGACIPRDLTPMAKIEAFDIPIIGAIVRWYGAFAVRRGEVDLNAFKTSLKILAGGGAVVIAPEGHRSATGSLQQGREGAIMLSLRSQAPILPVAVWGGKPLWTNLVHLRRTEMYFHVGTPVVPRGFEGKPSRDQIKRMSDELMVLIADMMPDEVRGYYRQWKMSPPYLLNPVPEESLVTLGRKEDIEKNKANWLGEK